MISVASPVTRVILLTLQASQLFSCLRQMEPEGFRKLAAILRILMNPQLDVLAESFEELVEIVLVLRNLLEQVKALLDDILADDLENLVCCNIS
jgi:hypothetical protein